MEDRIRRNVRKFCVKMIGLNPFGLVLDKSKESEWSSPRNMSRWVKYLAFDSMDDLCFSHNFEMLDPMQKHFVIEIPSTGTQGLNTSTVMNVTDNMRSDVCRVSFIYASTKTLLRDLTIAQSRYEDFGQKQASIRTVKADKVESEDIIYFLKNSKDVETGECFTVPDLVSEAALLIRAGTDTTAAAIAAALICLLHSPRTLEKLRFKILAISPTSMRLVDAFQTVSIFVLVLMRRCE
ncbi:MAG: hypothetical protein Q9214_000912 [Letrouitia sp. 1 TL-2023]